MAKVVWLRELGGPDCLRLEETEIGNPGPHELRVAIATIGLNRADVALRNGTYVRKPDLPSRLGFEGAGYVTDVGRDVMGFDIGDYVSFIPSVVRFDYGLYAEEALMPATLAVRTPIEIRPREAAAMWMQYLTAYGGLVEAGMLRSGQTVLITAASSSVGLAAIQICRKFGAHPIAATRSRTKVKSLLDAGAEDVVVSTEESIDKAVLALTGGKGAHLIFDCVAGDGVMALGAAAAYNGTIILYGALATPAAPFPFMAAVNKGLTMRAFYLLELTEKPDWLERGKTFTLAGVRDCSLKPVIARSFPLEEVARAHVYLESNDQFGKIIMTTRNFKD